MEGKKRQESDRDVWKEDPEYPYEDWIHEVMNESTLRGYWDWVKAKKEEAKHDFH